MSCGERGTVKVVNGRFKLNGHFHFINPNTPICDEEGVLMGVTNPRDIIHIHMYGGEAPFFEGLKDGKLLGTKCANPDCEFPGTVYLPFRIHCADCLQKNEIVDLTETVIKTAKVHSFMVTERTGAFNTLPIPIRFVNVEFEGVDTILMSVLYCAEPEIGMRVVPVFRKKEPTFTILDLSFVPEGTPEADLPEDYSY